MATLNRLFVVPTAETMTYFRDALSASPLEFDFDDFHVDIINTQSGLETEPSIVYKARAGTLNIFYDSTRGESSLILPLSSADMQIRYDQLACNGIYDSWVNELNPHLVLIKNMPPSVRHARGFRNSISTTFATTDFVFTFHKETCVVENQDYPLNFDYLVSVK